MKTAQVTDWSSAYSRFRPDVLSFLSRRLWGRQELAEDLAQETFARALKADGAQARFILVGRRDPANPTDVAEAAIRGWEAEGVVEWWGFRTDMPQVLPQAHIVCMPSYREGLPRGLIEAAACGLPIVTADVPGCREVVRHGENEF